MTLRAGAYLRVSTDDQTKGYGLDVQDTECTRFIEQQGWTLADLYTDDGVSGSLLERPEMDRLLADARAGRVDVVVVYKLDRIGRTNRVYFELEGRFKDLDVPIVSATQGVSTDSEDDELMVGVLSTFGQLERTIIRRRTQGGLQRAAEDGAWPGGMPPYGYKSQRRPRGQGKRGSFLVIDEAEAAVLRAAYRYLVEDGLDVGDTAARLNARGMVTRSGKPWSVVNLRARLLAESTTEARVVFRNPARASAGRGVKLDKDGKPKHGATVTISLPPIFEPAEVAELREALRPTRPGTGPERRAYPLSGRLFGQCGAHYVGAKSGRKDRPSGAGVGPAYKCRGRRAHHRGDSVCDDSAIPAHEMEQRVWAEVVALLGDAARLRAMAAEWVDSQRGADVDHAARVAELDAQIAERSATLTRTAADYMRAGVAPELVKAATDELGAELDALKRERDDAARWLAQAEQATARATDLEALAVGARERLADLGPDERAEVLQLLDVRVTVTGPVPMPQIGTPCSLSRWFIDNDRLVPAELDEEAWALVEPIVAEWEAGRRTHSGTMLDGRAVLNAVLFKARTRCTWREIPERYGNGNSIHTRWKRWQADGVWARIMDALPNAGTPHLGMVGLPPVRIEGRVDPRLVADAGAGPETAPQETGSPGPVTSAMSAGCHLLLRDRQAACVTCAEDVLDQIGPLGGVAPGPVRLSAELAPESARVLDAIPRSGGGPAVIARACGRDLEPTMRALGLLAAAGLVERCPAGWRRTR